MARRTAPAGPVRHPVAIVGAGPVGLAMAIDLATRGIASVVLDEDETVATGSRAICWAKRTLDIFDRLGIGERVVGKGVTWKLGRVFHGEREIDTIDLLPEDGHRRPAFVNLQQPYVETYLVERAADFPDLVDIRWRHRVTGLETRPDSVALALDTPDGPARLDAAWVVAADGARSAVRQMLGLSFEGPRFDEQFLIADLRVGRDGPGERRFWFRPPFDPAESVLMHRQPDDVVRIDFQLGPDADPVREKEPERVLARARRVLGDEAGPLELVWCSVYRFRCARTERFVHGRVILVGDAAHVVSPFGARGGNGGIQDVDNLAWKLALVCRGEAPPSLVASYDDERGRGADENIRHSARTTAFMTPKSPVERAFRDAVLTLAADHPFARRLVNGGRLSKPCSLDGLALQTPDDGRVGQALAAGSACPDAPVTGPDGREGWLLDRLGHGFVALVFAGPDGTAPEGWQALPPAIRPLLVLPADARPAEDAPFATILDRSGHVRARYGGRPGSAYLIRPDQHVAAGFAAFDPAALAAAHRRATGQPADRGREAA